MPPLPARKFKVPTTILRTTADGRFEARLVTPGLMQKHDTDRAIVAAEDKLGRSQNDKKHSNAMASSWVKCPGTVVASEVSG